MTSNLKRNSLFSFLACLTLSLTWSTGVSAQAIGDPVAGKAKSFACSGCHGLGGTKAAYPDVYKVPKLGGQHAAYIVAALKAYKSGERFNETMKAQASMLSDKDMADIAAYYAADKK